MGGQALTDDMNIFLRSKKVLQVEKHFVNTEQNIAWVFCISYLDEAPVGDKSKPQTDYSKILNEAVFKRFSKMREIRKQLAQDDGIPAYAVFTDEELVGIAKIEDLTLTKMKTIKGIGEKKIEKYGKHFLEPIGNEKSE